MQLRHHSAWGGEDASGIEKRGAIAGMSNLADLFPPDRMSSKPRELWKTVNSWACHAIDTSASREISSAGFGIAPTVLSVPPAVLQHST